MSNAPTPVLRIETANGETLTFAAFNEPAVRTLRFKGFTATKVTTGGVARIELGLPAAVESDSCATVVDWAAEITLDWTSIPTKTVRITCPENMADTSFVSTGQLTGCTYTLILEHPLGGFASNGLVWTSPQWRTNIAFTTNFPGSPGEGLVLQFVAVDNKMIQTAGNNYTI